MKRQCSKPTAQFTLAVLLSVRVLKVTSVFAIPQVVQKTMTPWRIHTAVQSDVNFGEKLFYNNLDSFF